MYFLSDEDPAPKAPAKKNKRRWCGGHEGREHIPIITKSTWAGGFQCRYTDQKWRKKHYTTGTVYACYHEVTCEKCHKTLRYKSDSCPDRLAAWDKYMKEKENT